MIEVASVRFLLAALSGWLNHQQTGRAPDELVQDALAAYLEELASLRETLDTRYGDLKGGRVKPIDGKVF